MISPDNKSLLGLTNLAGEYRNSAEDKKESEEKTMMKINGDALRKKAAMVDLIATLYDKVEDARKWDIMTCVRDDDGNTVWKDPENWDDEGWGCLTYREKNDVYEQILKAIEKVAEKI